MRLLVFLCLSLVFALPSHAEDLLEKAQRELRVRKYYFGEVHGYATDETVGAIRKFQEARGVDSTGNLDAATLRALGLRAAGAENDDARVLGECCDFVRRYVQARESGDWEREGPLFAATVNHYKDGIVDRAFIRKVRERYNARWPSRKITLLQRVAAFVADTRDAVQVTARVRVEVAARGDEPEVNMEDLLFRLEKTDSGWCIAAVKLL